MKNQYVLGIHFTYHDSGAFAIGSDGKRIGVSEERLNRYKYTDKFPELSIAYCVAECGLKDVDDFDLIIFDSLGEFSPDALSDIIVERLKVSKDKVKCIPSHHLSHACNAFLCSPFEQAAIMVIDGMGSMVNGQDERLSLYYGNDREMTEIKKTYSQGEDYDYGIGLLYLAATLSLNWHPLDGGKMMGLAPYGKGHHFKDLNILEDVGDHDYLYSMKKFSPDRSFDRNFGVGEDKSITLVPLTFFGAPRPASSPLPDDYYTDLAYSVQNQFEKAVIETANYAYEKTKCKYLCYSGGSALNSVANKKMLDQTPFEEIFIQPAASDCGIPLGNALYGYHILLDQPRDFVMKTAYVGKTYSDKDITEAINKFKS